MNALRRTGPRDFDLLHAAPAAIKNLLQNHIGAAAENERGLDPHAVDAPEGNVREVDLDPGPFVESERPGALGGADLEQLHGGDHVPPQLLAARSAFKLPQLFQRVDANVRVRADAKTDPALPDPPDGREAVAEIRLGRRTHTDAPARFRQEVELGVVRMRSVHDCRPRPETAGLGEKLNRSEPVLGHTFLDLARLLIGMDVEYELLPLRIAADLA